MASTDIYCIDSSSLLQAWQRAYPPHMFPGLWAHFDDLIERGRLIASVEVFFELKRKHDELAQWAKDRRKSLFVELDEGIQPVLRDLMAAYPRLVDTKTGKSGADPFVIALAKTVPRCVVVSDELGGSEKSPKIPSVCRAEKVPCVSILQMIEREGWTFN